MYIKRSHHPAAAADYAACYDPGTALLVLGTASAAIGAVRAGKAVEAQEKLRADALRQEAESAAVAAAEAEEDFRIEQSRIGAARRAAFARSGVVPTAGSPLLVSEEIARRVQHAALRIRTGFDPEILRLKQEARLREFTGSTARQAGLIKGFATLGSGLSKVDFS
jgi:hypothetical protein